MKRFILPLLLLLTASTCALGQSGKNIYAAADKPSVFLGCTDYTDAVQTDVANKSRNAASTRSMASMRLLNQANAVQALINQHSANLSKDFRVMRSVDPELGWEFVAELDGIHSDGPIGIKDEHPLPGRMLYKLESRSGEGTWATMDIRVVNRPLGINLEDIDFLTAPFGALTLPQTMLPTSDYTVEVFDLQGGHIESSYVRFGHKLKLHTSHLSFGVYEVVITGQSSRVAKYFLATGN